MDYTALGHAANLAARMEQIAETRSIISPSTPPSSSAATSRCEISAPYGDRYPGRGCRDMLSGVTDVETRYAKSGDLYIAYHTVGEGTLDLVIVPGFVWHLEHQWEWPEYAAMLRRLASFSRLILFDKRGTGLSDRVPP